MHQPFPLNFTTMLPLVSAVFVFTLSVIVFMHNSRAKVNRLFGLFSLGIAFWLAGSFMMFTAPTKELAIWWDRFVYIGIISTPLPLYLLGVSFSGISGSRTWERVGYILTFFFLLISRTPYFVDDLFVYRWGVHTEARFFHHLFLIFFFAYLLKGLWYLWAYVKNAQGKEEKARAQYVFYAFVFLLIIGPLAYLPAYRIGIYPITFSAGIIFSLLLTYAITRYELFNLKAVAAEIFVLFTTAFLAIQIFTVDNFQTQLLYALVLGVVVLIGTFLIQSVFTEMRHKGMLERLTGELKDLNENLQQKVDEQTKDIRTAYEVEKQARLELEHLNRAKNDFILSAQHNLRTPLTVAKGYVQEAKSSNKDTPLQEHLSKAAGALETMTELVNKLLDVTELEVKERGDKKPS